MQYVKTIGVLFEIAVLTTTALGHGVPIQMNVSDGRITVANGLALNGGYARFAWDPDEDAEFDVRPGQRLESEFPGFNVAGLAADASLKFEILSRPDYIAAGHPTRWLWFWNAATQAIGTAANDPAFYVSPLFGSGMIQVRQSNLDLGPELTMADPVGPFVGADQHLLLYELQNAPAAASGVYGVFGSLVSPGIESSEPFLLAFRYGVAVDDFAIAASAINSAAGVAGDYNSNGVVDAADYTVWRDTLGSATALAADGSGNHVVDQADYGVWKTNFGHIAGGAGSAAEGTAIVPEPSAGVLVAWACLAAAALSRKRRASSRPEPCESFGE